MRERVTRGRFGRETGMEPIHKIKVAHNMLILT